jgi:hypothetical protein
LNYYLIYTSRTRDSWSNTELIELLKKSWTNNKRNDVSGMLVYIVDRFIQLIEGERSVVLDTFNRIRQDPRHEGINTLIEGESETRIFKNWSMGFKTLDTIEFEQMSGFSDPASFFNDDNIKNHSHPAFIFLKLFYDKNYRDFKDRYLT